MGTTQKLPVLSAFEDKSISNGLKYIVGGAGYTATEGGEVKHEGSPVQDYVADASYGGITIRGFCSAFKTPEEFYSSDTFRSWLSENGL